MIDLGELVARVEAFRADASQVLGDTESSPLRVRTVEHSIRKLNLLSLPQDELLRQALFCTARGYYRPAIVAAWSALMDALESKLASDSFAKLHGQFPAWSAHKTIEDIRDHISEYQIIEAARSLRLITKGEMKILHGHLAKRNKCAHPSELEPGYNDTLGYVSEMLDWISKIQSRVY